MKKLILLSGLLVLASAGAFAQYTSHQDFFFYNKVQFNPAFLAEEDRTNIVFAGKFYPWDKDNSYPARDGYAAFEGYSDRMNSRYGVSLERAMFGNASASKYRFLYAYDVKLFNEGLVLTPSMGISYNKIMFNLDRYSQESSDPLIIDGIIKGSNLDIDFGFRVNYRTLNFGISTHNMLESKMKFNSDSFLVRNHKVSEVFLSNRFKISDHLSIEPFSRVYELRNFIDDERPNPLIYLGSTVFLSERYSLGFQVETYNEAFSFFGGVRIADLVELNLVFADLKELKEVDHYALNAVLKVFLQETTR